MKLNRVKCHTKTTVSIQGGQYDVEIYGQGGETCLIIGVATLMIRTLSKSMHEHLNLYSSDLYWTKKNPLRDVSTLDMSRIVNDLISMVNQLGLNDFILLAHSAYGIVALELAKHCKNIKGIILVGSPPVSNQELATFNEKYFISHASDARKQNDTIRKQQYRMDKQEGESLISLNAYESQSARYWYDFNISHDFLVELWDGCEFDDAIANKFFLEILPQHEITNDVSEIVTPVLLVAGEHDYDCLPLVAWKHFGQKTKNFTIKKCDQSGHWPQIECPQQFDANVLEWLSDISNCS